MPHERLETAIREMHGCDAVHVASEQVHELFQGQTAWHGTVEVFNLIGHPKAKRAYAWQYEEGNDIKTVTVLEIPPVNSAKVAVKVAVSSHIRKV